MAKITIELDVPESQAKALQGMPDHISYIRDGTIAALLLKQASQRVKGDPVFAELGQAVATQVHLVCQALVPELKQEKPEAPGLHVNMGMPSIKQ